MEEVKLQATERINKRGKFKESGFVPGVLYGDGTEGSAAVKFETSELVRILTAHGANAKVSVVYNKNKNPGMIKEIQREPVSGRIIHVDVQIMSKEHVQSFKVPLVFVGEGELKNRLLALKVHKNEVNLNGTLNMMPESIEIDVSQKALGDKITLKDFKLNKKIKVEDAEEEIYAAVVQGYAVAEEAE